MSKSPSKTFLQLVQDTPPPCTEVDPELFFRGGNQHHNETHEQEAKAVCRKCPIHMRKACLDFAIETDDQWAILGGKTPTERGRDAVRMERQERFAA